MAARSPRSLIIVSRDYGELGLACSLLRGQRLAAHATLMLPGPLFFENERSLPATALPYSNVQDILNVARAQRPELVFLLSGYLLSNDKLLSSGDVEEIVRHFQESGATLLTSDPFLGLAATINFDQVDMEMLAARHRRQYRLLLRILLWIRSRRGVQFFDVPAMRAAIHLYATAVPTGEELSSVRRLSFFNPTLVRASGERGDGAGSERGSPATWLFVLSTADLHGQSVVTGLLPFLDHLVARLEDAMAAGRRPILIGSPWLFERLAGRVSESVELVSSCPFAEFEERLLAAEYAFYWNTFSHSLLARVANGLPVFLFDRGHLAHTIKPFHDAALACHFAGIELTELDQTLRLDVDDLAQRAAAKEADLRAILAHWSASPTPDELGELLHAEREKA